MKQQKLIAPKKLIVVLFACFLSATSVFAHSTNQIVFNKKSAFFNDKKLSKQELADILMSEPASAAEYQKAKSNSTIAAVPLILGTGLCLVGAVISLTSSVDDANSISKGSLETTDPAKYMTPILAGAGLVLIGIPFALSSNKHMKKSVMLYNSSRTTGFIDKVQLDFGFTQNGVGVVCRF